MATSSKLATKYKDDSDTTEDKLTAGLAGMSLSRLDDPRVLNCLNQKLHIIILFVIIIYTA